MRYLRVMAIAITRFFFVHFRVNSSPLFVLFNNSNTQIFIATDDSVF